MCLSLMEMVVKRSSLLLVYLNFFFLLLFCCLESAEPGVHCTEYTPKVKGLHSINVFHRKNQIENSPFALRVSDNTRKFSFNIYVDVIT